MEVFWPVDVPTDNIAAGGWLVGWMVPPRFVCVVAVVPYSQCAEPEMRALLTLQQQPLAKRGQLLGQLQLEAERTPPTTTNRQQPWLHILANEPLDKQRCSLPRFRRLTMYNIASESAVDSTEEVQRVLFYDPTALHHSLYTTQPLTLSSSCYNVGEGEAFAHPNQHQQRQVVGHHKITPQVVGPPEETSIPSSQLDECLRLLNSGLWPCREFLQRNSRGSRHPSIERSVGRGKSCMTIFLSLLLTAGWLLQPLTVPLLHLLNIPFPSLFSNPTNGPSLTALSLTAIGQEVARRRCFLQSWQTEWKQLCACNTSTPTWRVLEQRCYHRVWSLIVDLFLGCLVAWLLWNHSQILSASSEEWGGAVDCHFIYQMSHLSDSRLRAGVEWLMGGKPAGIKLNHPLAHFFGSIFLYLLSSWQVVMRAAVPLIPMLLKGVALSGLFGLSMMISFVLDILSLLHIHIFYCYTVSVRCYAFQFHILSSLWKLFRGKKRNVLKQRIDSYAYDIDQLILGTLLFTTMFFLLPTTFAYYLYFTGARLAVLAIYLSFYTALHCLHHFPFYSIFLRILYPASLPGGVSFSVLQACPASSSTETASYLLLKSEPAPLAHLFSDFEQALLGLINENRPGSLLARFLTGSR
ncbi:pig-Q [Balamuthia mandrillaris]